MHPVLLALVASTGVGIHVAETEGVSSQEVLSLVDLMKSQITARTTRPVAIDSGDWEQCQRRGPCLDAVRDRTRASDVVILRVIAGPRTLVVAAERFYADLDATRTSSASLAKSEPSSWPDKVHSMVDRLFPEMPQLRPEPPPPPIAAVTTPPAEPSIVPWIVLGASGAVAAAGLGFGISNHVARGQLEREVLLEEERDSLENRTRVHGIASIALFSTAAAGAVAALLIYAFD